MPVCALNLLALVAGKCKPHKGRTSCVADRGCGWDISDAIE